MFCVKCGNEMPDTARFCPKCGQQVGQPVVMQEQNINLDDIASSLTEKANALFQNAKPMLAKGAEVARHAVNESAKVIQNLTDKPIEQTTSIPTVQPVQAPVIEAVEEPVVTGTSSVETETAEGTDNHLES